MSTAKVWNAAAQIGQRRLDRIASATSPTRVTRSTVKMPPWNWYQLFRTSTSGVITQATEMSAAPSLSVPLPRQRAIRHVNRSAAVPTCWVGE
ncbi:MAG: hypothetical protein WA840_08005 [Caulobacteraceae bacterium]